MKKVVLILLVSLVGFSSCARRYTCPTYLQNSEKQEDVKAKNTKTDEKNLDEKN